VPSAVARWRRLGDHPGGAIVPLIWVLGEWRVWGHNF